MTYIPESVNASSKAPLIVELHGWAASAPDTRNHTEIVTLADEVGAIVVHGEGILVDNSTLPFGGNEESWNAGYCCGDAYVYDKANRTHNNYTRPPEGRIRLEVEPRLRLTVRLGPRVKVKVEVEVDPSSSSTSK